MRITQLLVLGLLATSLPVQFAVADADGERAALARITHELQAIEPLRSKNSSVPRYQHLTNYCLCHNAFVFCLK